MKQILPVIFLLILTFDSLKSTNINTSILEAMSPPVFYMEEVCGNIGDTISLSVSTKSYTNINGFQYSVHVDTNMTSIIGVSDFGLTNWGIDDFTIDSVAGTITLTRTAEDVMLGESVVDSTVLFKIDVELVGTPSTSSPYIDGHPTPVVVSQNGMVVEPVLEAGNLCTWANVSIQGNIYTWYNEDIQQVNMVLSGTMVDSSMTDSLGNYGFSNLNIGSDLTITPEKNTDVTNGVNILDVIAIKQHIFNQVPFVSAYKMLAADVNGSQSISMLDVVFIKKVIRGEIENFPIGQSWRFIPDDYIFVEPGLPSDFPESRSYQDLDMDYWMENFIGLKVGDVTGDANPNH